jgi:hypothetical protein
MGCFVTGSASGIVSLGMLPNIFTLLASAARHGTRMRICVSLILCVPHIPFNPQPSTLHALHALHALRGLHLHLPKRPVRRIKSYACLPDPSQQPPTAFASNRICTYYHVICHEKGKPTGRGKGLFNSSRRTEEWTTSKGQRCHPSGRAIPVFPGDRNTHRERERERERERGGGGRERWLATQGRLQCKPRVIPL